MFIMQRKGLLNFVPLLVFLSIVATYSFASFATSLNSSCDEIIVSAHPDYAPFHWVEEGQFSGASIDITGRILDSMGIPWRAEYVGPWKRVLQEASSGNIDLIPALKKNKEREEFLSFTKSHFYANPIAIYQKKTSMVNAVEDLEELSGLIGSVNSGDSHGERVDAFLSAQNVIQVKGIEQNFEMLDLGRTDYFVIGKQTAERYLQNKAAKNQFELILEIDNAVVHHGFSKRSTCLYLKKEFERRLQQMVESGEVENTISTYKERWSNRKPVNE